MSSQKNPLSQMKPFCSGVKVESNDSVKYRTSLRNIFDSFCHEIFGNLNVGEVSTKRRATLLLLDYAKKKEDKIKLDLSILVHHDLLS